MSDTPRTDALLTELSIVKLAPFEQIVHDTNRHVALTRELERETAQLQAEIAHLNHQHANDEAANRMLSEACNNLREDRDKWKALETEAATYVESPIVLMTHFTGEHPYVGWKGLGLALTETLEKATAARASTIKECAALFSGGVRNRELYVNDVEEMILGLLKE